MRHKVVDKKIVSQNFVRALIFPKFSFIVDKLTFLFGRITRGCNVFSE